MTTNTDTINCPVAAIAAEIAEVLSARAVLLADDAPPPEGEEISPSFVAKSLGDRLEALQELAAQRRATSATGAALHVLLAYSAAEDFTEKVEDDADNRWARRERGMERCLASALSILLGLGAKIPAHVQDWCMGIDIHIWSAIEQAAPSPGPCVG